MLRLEQIDIVVVAQQATRNLGDFRELTDFEHTYLATRAAWDGRHARPKCSYFPKAPVRMWYQPLDAIMIPSLHVKCHRIYSPDHPDRLLDHRSIEFVLDARV